MCSVRSKQVDTPFYPKLDLLHRPRPIAVDAAKSRQQPADGGLPSGILSSQPEGARRTSKTMES